VASLTLHGFGRGALRRDGDDVKGTLTLEAGDAGGVILESSCESPPRTLSRDELVQLLDETTSFWRSWLHQTTYRGRWREMVGRSAITLKLMTYAPTGALVAARRQAGPKGLAVRYRRAISRA
jgi:GH15 family glucan-1,4-alpha-glucosidase